MSKVRCFIIADRSENGSENKNGSRKKNGKWDKNRRMELRMERKISSGKICESENLNKNRNGNESGIRTSLQILFQRFSL